MRSYINFKETYIWWNNDHKQTLQETVSQITVYFEHLHRYWEDLPIQMVLILNYCDSWRKMKWNIYNCTTKIMYYSRTNKLKQLLAKFCYDSMFWWRSFSMMCNIVWSIFFNIWYNFSFSFFFRAFFFMKSWIYMNDINHESYYTLQHLIWSQHDLGKCHRVFKWPTHICLSFKFGVWSGVKIYNKWKMNKKRKQIYLKKMQLCIVFFSIMTSLKKNYYLYLLFFSISFLHNFFHNTSVWVY